MLVISTSAVSISLRACSRSVSSLRLRATLRLLRLTFRFSGVMPGVVRYWPTRTVSAGDSILITSAPRSPRIWAAYGPMTTVERSITRTPSSGPVAVLVSVIVRPFAPCCFALLTNVGAWPAKGNDHDTNNGVTAVVIPFSAGQRLGEDVFRGFDEVPQVAVGPIAAPEQARVQLGAEIRERQDDDVVEPVTVHRAFLVEHGNGESLAAGNDFGRPAVAGVGQPDAFLDAEFVQLVVELVEVRRDDLPR